MCGIAGVISKNNHSYSSNVQKMIQAIYHRGPDMQSVKEFENATLGHLRLSIVDLITGQQPMKSSVSSSYIVFNGEIYGYKDLFKELTDYPFATNSDTELILAMYEKYGKNLINKLPGMFSFAIWDDTKKTLFAARDRFGEKPFFYAISKKGEFVFASEIKAILASGLIEPVLDFNSVAHYLKYLYVHPYKTIYTNIHTLPPAHCLSFESGEVKVEKYWGLPLGNYSGTFSNAVEQFKFLLEESIKKQMIADVPVGAFLSGGLDSSTIVALASKYSPGIETFSFGFEDSIDELPFAKQIANKYGTIHNEIKQSEHNIGEYLLLMGDIYDEPFADSSNIPTFLISKFASKLKVILTGDGADELLAGYDFWYDPLMKKRANKNISNRIKFLPPFINFSSNKKFSIKSEYEQKSGVFTDLEISLILKGDFKRPLIYSDLEIEDIDSLNTALKMDIKNYMPGDILVKTDRASMANSLELRSPFLDVDLASFCITLPQEFKMKSGVSKHILRESFQTLWTDEISKRPKQGFGAPINKWLKLKSIDNIKNIFLNDPTKKIFKDIISFDNSRSIVLKDNYQTWSLLVLSIWAEKYEYKI